MAALMMGIFSRMLRESWVCVLVLAGTTPECAGRSNTSSNVRASGTGKWIIGFWKINFYCREGPHIKQMQSTLSTQHASRLYAMCRHGPRPKKGRPFSDALLLSENIPSLNVRLGD